MPTLRTVALVAALAVATSAQASGFYFGDNGSKALLQGGAFTAQADDLTAIMYNPAGLAQLDGVQFAIDAQLINHDTSFKRQDPGFDPNNPSALPNTVTNTGGIFFLPFIGASYALNLMDHRLTLALGVYGPPSDGRYNYGAGPNGEPDICATDAAGVKTCRPAEPNYAKDANGKYIQSPRKYAPARYSLINNDIIIIYPSFSAAFQIHRRFSVGISLQLVVSKFMFRQALYSGLSTPTTQAGEDPLFDSLVTVNLDGKVNFTGIVGAMFSPLDNLQFGASFRPPIPIRANGTLALELGEAAQGLNSVVTGDQAELKLTLPMELRIGARFQPIKRLGINADFVYQGWDSVKELLLTPKDISLKIGSGESKPVAPFHIPKNWHATYSVRVGASFDVIKYLTLHAGFFYETAAAPDEYTDIGFLHFDRFFISGGVTAHLWKLDLVAGVAGSPPVNKAVTTSLVTAGSTDPEIPGSVVGLGLYSSGGWIATVGLRGHFGGSSSAPPPPPPEPMPTPASTPAPEATPAPEKT
jgi:long-chain fatty acid transport protein